MSAEGGITSAGESTDEIAQGRTEMATLDKSICGSNPNGDGEGGTADLITDPRWHVKAKME